MVDTSVVDTLVTGNPVTATQRAERSRRGYDRLAPYYRLLETLAFGHALMRARTALLPRLPQLERALIVGEGDGRFLKAFVQCQPQCAVTCVEHSSSMVALARRRLSGAERIQFVLADALEFTPVKKRYDVIITAFFLDCFSEAVLHDLIPRLLGGLRPGGLWYYADFTRPENRLGRLRADLYLHLMHRFFRWQTGLETRSLVDTRPIFTQHGLKLLAAQTTNLGLLTTKLYRYQP